MGVGGVAVAPAAGDQDDLLAFRLHTGRLQTLEHDVAELDFHRRAGVELQGHDAARAAHRRVLVGHFAHHPPVDLLDHVISPGDDVVLVPVLLLDDGGQLLRVARLADDLGLVVGADHGFLAAVGQHAAVALPVVGPREGIAGVHVGLVSADDPLAPLLRLLPTAVLDPGVAADHAELHFQLEVVRLALAPDEERVALGRVLPRGLAGDGAVFDPPELRVAVPAVQRLAVEDRLEAGVLGPRRGNPGPEQRSENRKKQHSPGPSSVLQSHGILLAHKSSCPTYDGNQSPA